MSNSVNPVGWFEIPVMDIDRAQDFYEYVFDMALERHTLGDNEMAWFPMNELAVGAAGALVMGDCYIPAPNGIVIYISTPDISETLERVEEKGGHITEPKKSIGKHGFVAFFTDLEGNQIGVHSQGL